MVLTCCMHSVPSQSLQDQDACACRPYAGQSHLQSWQTPTPCQSTGRHKHTMLTSGRPCTLPVMLPSTEACASQRAADSLVLTTLMRSTTLHIPAGTLPRLMMSMQVVLDCGWGNSAGAGGGAAHQLIPAMAVGQSRCSDMVSGTAHRLVPSQ